MSRSSALASKASGYPLAFVAAKLALGYTLDQIGEMGTPNSAYVPPSVDYIIAKIPRWDLSKFVGVDREIGSSMKSVGEIMSIGKSFEEIMQKGLRMIGQGMHGFVGNNDLEFDDLDKELTHPTDMRIFAIAKALENGYTPERIEELTKIDVYFIKCLKNIVDYTKVLSKYNKIEDLPADVLAEAKRLGFSDFQIARYVENPTGTMEKEQLRVRDVRKKFNILPAVRRINTVASEHPELTNYLYMTYGEKEHSINYAYKNDKSIVVLGSGAYRIGSSVEFDWCSVNAIQTARKFGYKSIMINYNPETVSTDYDMCDRLYFAANLFDAASRCNINVLCREHQSSITRVNARKFNMFRNTVFNNFTILRNSVEFNFFCILQEFRNHNRIFLRNFCGGTKECVHLVFVVTNVHCGTRKHIRRTNQNRETNFVNELVDFVVACKSFPTWLVNAKLVEHCGEFVSVFRTVD